VHTGVTPPPCHVFSQLHCREVETVLFGTRTVGTACAKPWDAVLWPAAPGASWHVLDVGPPVPQVFGRTLAQKKQTVPIGRPACPDRVLNFFMRLPSHDG